MLNSPFGRFVFHLGSLKGKINEEEYFEICQLNEMLVIERNQDGDWEIQSLNGSTDGLTSAALTGAVGDWAKKDGTGIGFGAFTGFTLPNGAVRAPDLAWMLRQKWKALSQEEREKFAPACPDFVVEIRGVHESIGELKSRMEEYITNGALLGWLIDPFDRRIHVYRPGMRIEVLDDPKEISGEPLLKGFSLDVQALWAAGE